MNQIYVKLMMDNLYGLSREFSHLYWHMMISPSHYLQFRSCYIVMAHDQSLIGSYLIILLRFFCNKFVNEKYLGKSILQ